MDKVLGLTADILFGLFIIAVIALGMKTHSGFLTFLFDAAVVNIAVLLLTEKVEPEDYE